MKTTDTPSRLSPKNAYRVEITYDPALDFGSVESFGTITLDSAKQQASKLVAQRRSGIKGERIAVAHVHIWHNRAEYPTFDWEDCASYDEYRAENAPIYAVVRGDQVVGGPYPKRKIAEADCYKGEEVIEILPTDQGYDEFKASME